LVYFVVRFSHFGLMCQEKSGNPGIHWPNFHQFAPSGKIWALGGTLTTRG
jgi:hypothetical protein